MSQIVSSVTLFVLAGLAEIGGGYRMWPWWRGGRAWPVGVAGAVTLVLYGIIPTYQPAHFGRRRHHVRSASPLSVHHRECASD